MLLEAPTFKNRNSHTTVRENFLVSGIIFKTREIIDNANPGQNVCDRLSHTKNNGHHIVSLVMHANPFKDVP
jgi:hypothetical protein